METSIIRNGLVYDGTGHSPETADVAIADGQIRAVAPGVKLPGARVLDAKGLFVAPGFIDMHSHGDFLAHFSGKVRQSRVLQGITTDLSGQCGLGPAPYTSEMEQWRQYITPVIGNPAEASWNWPRFGDFLDEMDARPCPHHRAYLVAHGAIRTLVTGLHDRTPDRKELRQMSAVLDQSLLDGAFGMSFGLSYLPGLYAHKDEMIQMARILEDAGRIFMVHIRSHSMEINAAVEEMLDVARNTGVRMHISHLKSYANRTHGVEGQSLRQSIHQAFDDEGIDITYDEHPYSAGSTTLSQVLPPWIREGGASRMLQRLEDPNSLDRLRSELSDSGFSTAGWDNYSAIAGWHQIRISAAVQERNKQYEQMSIADLARLWNTDEIDAVVRFIKDEGGASCMVMANIFSDEDLAVLLASEHCMVGSDGIPTGIPHPRLFGTFPLFLRKTVKEWGSYTWEEALHVITGKSALRLGLGNKGLIRKGYDADLVIFDPEQLDVPEDYANPWATPAGLKHVFVRGTDVLNSPAEPGGVLRAGFRP